MPMTIPAYHQKITGIIFAFLTPFKHVVSLKIPGAAAFGYLTLAPCSIDNQKAF
jgi:hypothetical protein